MADVSTPVSTPCAEYKAAAAQWELIEDATAGEYAIKAKRDKYLPRPNPSDKSQQNCERYDSYLLRALFYNASGRTVDGLTGLAFSKDPEIKTPASLDDVVANLDGAGTTLVQHMHETLAEVLKNGRAGLLADFPKTQKPTSRADEQQAGIRPTVSYYPALSIINWRTIVVGSKAKLSLLVLRETHREYDGFGEKITDQYRVLKLDPTYVVEIWRQKMNDQTRSLEWAIAETSVPVDGKGAVLTEIPFTFVGSRNNGVEVNKAPIGDIAAVNVAHYRNSADYEDSVYITGQPQVWMSGLDETWRDHLEKSGIYLGSRSPLLLPANGQAGMMQAAPNTLAKEAMDAKEKQMAALGARLIKSETSIKTATQQESEDSVANSVLSLCCDNVSAAYQRAIEWAAMFANAGDGEVSISISTEFVEVFINPQELAALIQAVQSGLIPMSDFWSRMRMAGVIDPQKDDGQIQEEIDQNPPPGLGGGAGEAGAGNPGGKDPASAGA